jgi:hypothetical protein
MVQVKQANLAKGEDADRIAEAVANIADDLTPYSAWNELDALSSHTEVEAVEPLESQIFLEENRFAGNCVVYVQLNYGDRGDSASLSDSYPGKFRGHMDDGFVMIDDIEVDTSSFYA